MGTDKAMEPWELLRRDYCSNVTPWYDEAGWKHRAAAIFPATPPPASADAPGEVERVARALLDFRSPMEPGTQWAIETEEMRDWYRGLATAALSAMSPAGEVDRIVAWLRKQGGQLLRTGSSADKIAGAELLMKADAIERGDYRHDR